MDSPRKSGRSYPPTGVAMSEMDKIKTIIVQNMHRLCAHCMNGKDHDCKFKEMEHQILQLRGVPLMVNDEFRGVLIHQS